MKGIDIVSLGILLVFAGILLVAAGMLSQIKSKEAEVRGGGVILIGPFPIVFGSDAEAAKTVLILTILLILIVFFLFKLA
ncbi:MAG: DUF131 domain-containing protein [Euryarchaeota archaeon]|nr:DUF131 domain-containing protein [Euryarchaeota archaeon]